MAGTHEGRVIVFPQLTEVLTPFETKPQAKKILDAEGKVDYSTKGQSIILEPGKLIHTTAKLLHSVTALEDSTLMVIMLTGESHPEPNITIEVEQV